MLMTVSLQVSLTLLPSSTTYHEKRLRPIHGSQPFSVTSLWSRPKMRHRPFYLWIISPICVYASRFR